MKLFIGTQNPAKQEEHRRVFVKIASEQNIDIQLVFPQDLSINEEPEETGSTILENSLIKAKFYFEKSRLPTITDDGGFEIDALGGLPSVQAKYWAGPEGDDDRIIQKTIYELKKFKTKKERSARLTICLTYFDGKTTFQVKESIEGYIGQRLTKNYQKGFPYRALFIVLGPEKYYDELTREEHEQLNHREKAIKELFAKIVAQ